MNFIKSMAQGL